MRQTATSRSFWVTLAVAVGLAGCLAHSRSPSASFASQVPRDHPPPLPAFAYERSEIPLENRMLEDEETSFYRVRYVRFPSIGDNGQAGGLVRGKYYESKLPGRKPLVIVLPIWGGHVYPSEKTTASLTRRSGGRVNVFHMEGEKRLIDWQALDSAAEESAFLEAWRQGARREWVAVTDIRRTIDWAEGRAELDAQRIGLVGFSQGAVVAATVATQEPRLAAVALVMGGARPHEVLASCPLDRSEAARIKATAEFGWTPEDLERRLAPIFSTLDPANYPGRVDPDRVLIFEATRDDCMPETAREALWEAMGRPARIRLPYLHQQAFLAMTPLGLNWMRRSIWSFFRQALLPR